MSRNRGTEEDYKVVISIDQYSIFSSETWSMNYSILKYGSKVTLWGFGKNSK